MIYILTLIFGILTLLSFIRDRRSLFNPLLLIAFLGLAYISLLFLADQFKWDTLYRFSVLAGFGLLPLIIFFASIFLIYNGIILLKKEGKSKANFLSLGLGASVLLLMVSTLFRGSFDAIPWFNQLFNDLTVFLFLNFFFFGTIFAGFLLYSLLYHYLPKRKNYDFIIIHGAGLIGGERVTPLLQKRIDKAVEAFHQGQKHKLKLIASGGQGPDEKISEAQAIANYLESIDFPMDRVLLEDKSTTTYENLLFSKTIAEQTVPNPRFLFVTNDYHVFRTSLYAKQIGLIGDGLGCATASYYIPSAFIREYIAFLTKIKWLIILFYLPIIIFMIIYIIQLLVVK